MKMCCEYPGISPPLAPCRVGSLHLSTPDNEVLQQHSVLRGLNASFTISNLLNPSRISFFI